MSEAKRRQRSPRFIAAQIHPALQGMGHPSISVRNLLVSSLIMTGAFAVGGLGPKCG
jgi:hypothetical protein